MLDQYWMTPVRVGVHPQILAMATGMVLAAFYNDLVVTVLVYIALHSANGVAFSC